MRERTKRHLSPSPSLPIFSPGQLDDATHDWWATSLYDWRENKSLSLIASPCKDRLPSQVATERLLSLLHGGCLCIVHYAMDWLTALCIWPNCTSPVHGVLHTWIYSPFLQVGWNPITFQADATMPSVTNVKNNSAHFEPDVLKITTLKFSTLSPCSVWFTPSSQVLSTLPNTACKLCLYLNNCTCSGEHQSTGQWVSGTAPFSAVAVIGPLRLNAPAFN